MQVVPPIENYEMLQGYRIVLGYNPTSLFLHDIISSDRVVAGERAVMKHTAVGVVVVERDAPSPNISGGDLFRIKLEGLSTGIPLNMVLIDSAAFVASDSIGIRGNGLVILSGCDITRGFGFGKKVRIESVAPNPAGTHAYVRYHIRRGISASLFLVDLAGRDLADWNLPVTAEESAQTEIDLRTVPSGIYLLQIRDGAEYGSVPIAIVR